MVLWRQSRSTPRRDCGGPAFMIMPPVNGDVGIPAIGDIGGVLGITGTDDASLPTALVCRIAAELLRRARRERTAARVHLLFE
jgi:hypothetical protein